MAIRLILYSKMASTIPCPCPPFIIIALLILHRFISPSTSLECSSSLLPSATIYPVQLDKVTETVKRIGAPVERLAFNNTKGKASFFLHCEHTTPIRWVLDEDYLLGYISQPSGSPTLRTFQDFYNPSTYIYRAHYFLAVTPTKDHVFLCQPFEGRRLNSSSAVDCPTTAVVLFESKTTEVAVLSLDQILVGAPVLRDFYTKLRGQPLEQGSGNCSFKARVALGEPSKAFYIEWDSGDIAGNQNAISARTIQGLDNMNRFHPFMEKHCVKRGPVSDIRNENNALSYLAHKFYPMLHSYAVGDTVRLLKFYWVVKDEQDFFYSWEEVDPERMVTVRVDPPMVYKGQNFTMRCRCSVYFFSQGTQITWDFPTLPQNESLRTGLIPGEDFLGEEEFIKYGGLYSREARVFWDRDFLTENHLDEVELTCFCPRWNDPGWVNVTLPVPLLDSDLPEFVKDQHPDLYEIESGSSHKNLTISCQATGTPLPDVTFIYPKNNLNLTMTFEEVTVGGRPSAVTTLSFPKVTPQEEGDYVCVAKNVVGEARKVVQLRILTSLSQFVVVMLIVGSIFILLTASGAIVLLVKLRKERGEFLKATEEAIKKFREGYASSGEEGSSSLGFKADSEYKNYEIPIFRWALGNTLLGKGAFGVVKKGVIYDGGNQVVVAVKTVNSPKDVTDFETSLMELTIMSYLGKNENIVSLVGACTDNIGKRSLLIGVEYCGNGDLHNYMTKRKNRFISFVGSDGVISKTNTSDPPSSYTNVGPDSEEPFSTLDLYKWSSQIANGMDFLVTKKILHADLAARNVLLTTEGVCKISDFGLSRRIMDDNYTKRTNVPLPWPWMAFESLKYRQFSHASDTWAFGVLLFEIFSLGEVPWFGLGWTNEFMEELERGRRLAQPKFCSNYLYNTIMLETWRIEPKERISFAEAKALLETALSNLNSMEGRMMEV